LRYSANSTNTAPTGPAPPPPVTGPVIGSDQITEGPACPLVLIPKTQAELLDQYKKLPTKTTPSRLTSIPPLGPTGSPPPPPPPPGPSGPPPPPGPSGSPPPDLTGSRSISTRQGQLLNQNKQLATKNITSRLPLQGPTSSTSVSTKQGQLLDQNKQPITKTTTIVPSAAGTGLFPIPSPGSGSGPDDITITPSSTDSSVPNPNEPSPSNEEITKIKLYLIRTVWNRGNAAYNAIISRKIDIVPFLQKAGNSGSLLQGNKIDSVELELAVTELEARNENSTEACKQLLKLIKDAFVVDVSEYNDSILQQISEEVATVRKKFEQNLNQYSTWRQKNLPNLKQVNTDDCFKTLDELLDYEELEQLMEKKEPGDGEGVEDTLSELGGEETGEGTGEETGEGTGEGMDEGMGEETGEGAGEGMGEGTGEETGEVTGEVTGEETGEGTGEETGEEMSQGERLLNIDVFKTLEIDPNSTPAEIIASYNELAQGINFEEWKTKATLNPQQVDLLAIQQSGIMENEEKLKKFLAMKNEFDNVSAGGNASQANINTITQDIPPEVLNQMLRDAGAVEVNDEERVEMPDETRNAINSIVEQPMTGSKKLAVRRKTLRRPLRVVAPPQVPTSRKVTPRQTEVLQLPSQQQEQQKFLSAVNPVETVTERKLAKEQRIKELDKALQQELGSTTATTTLPEPEAPPPAPKEIETNKANPTFQRGLQQYYTPTDTRNRSAKERREQAKARTQTQIKPVLTQPYKKGGSRKKTLRARRGNTQNERRTRRSQNRPNRTHKNSRRRT